MTLATEPFVSKPIDAAQEPHAPRFTKAQYFQMVESGIFDDRARRLFLFRGELIEMPSMGWEHWHGTRRTNKWAFRAFGDRFEVVSQLPIDAPEDSVPEPDIAVYLPSEVERRPHPNRAELIIEISDSSLKLDRAKAHEYAVDAREYWILDVKRRVLHVYRNPHEDAAGLYGKAFDAPTTLTETESIAPLCDPAASVVVGDLLPPAA